MLPQPPGRMYLADQHGTTVTRQSSRCSIFSFAGFQDEQRLALGKLLAFNEETLLPGQRISLRAPAEASYLVVLPLTGEVEYQDPHGHTALVQVEELQVSTLPATATLELGNPYQTESVSLLHIWLRAEPGAVGAPTLFGYTFGQLENTLCYVLPGPVRPGPELPFSVSLGRFAGRQEAIHQPKSGALVFAYVLAGAFEVAGRLLHPKDGLALWEAGEIELEALSNNALVVMLEVPG